MKFDFVVVGAGSAGCAIANRLSESGKYTVCLLEAGGKDWNPWIHIPVGYFKTMHNPATDWCYETEADPGLNGRSLKWPRGKVLGGSSSINGLLYVRGQPEDYDRWRQLGNTGWAWDDVQPFFVKSEDQQRGRNEHHGTGGPLSVNDMRLKREICDAWVEAAQNAGYRYNEDYNGATQEGVGYFQLTSRNGLRCSSARAFLGPAKNRTNLEVITRAHTERVMFDGNRAISVEYRRDGQLHTVDARYEIVLSAGAIGSPQILMLSGIGDPQNLTEFDLPVLREAPHVGKNLQDHLQARLVYKCNEATLNDEVASFFGRMKIAAEYAMFRTGPMTMAASLVTAFLKTRDELATPDIQFHVQPWSADSPGEGVHPFSAFTASVCQLRPESRGELRLTSPDAAAYPAIHPNYLATQTDCDTVVAGIKVAQKIAACDPVAAKNHRRIPTRPGLQVR